MTDENLDIDVSADTDDEDGGDTIDYKALAEQERAAREKAEQDANKRKDRFKWAKAVENATKWVVDQETVRKMVDESVGVVKFYSENKDANQYQQDIEALVAKWIARDKAFMYVVAEKDPSLLLDEAKRNQLNGNTALNWVPAQMNGAKDYTKMSDEEIAMLPQEEFDKAFPSSQNSKKFYAE